MQRGRADAAAPQPLELFDLTGRVALVTGGTRGLGRAIVRALAQAGADVIVASRKQEACDEAAAEVRRLGRRALAHVCHVGHWDEIDAARRGLLRRVRASRRARQQRRPRADVPESAGRDRGALGQDARRQPEGPVPPHGARRRAHVRRRAAARSSNISSIGGVRPTHDILPYAAAKAGLNALTVGFADAFGPKVRVNAIMPGPFRTDISRHWDHDAFDERAQDVPPSPRRRARKSSRARSSISRATPRASRPARSSRSTGARSGASREAATRLPATRASTTASETGPEAVDRLS